MRIEITKEKLSALGEELGKELLVQLSYYQGILRVDEMAYWVNIMGWNDVVQKSKAA